MLVKYFGYAFGLFTLLVAQACHTVDEPDLSGVQVEFEFKNFEKDVFENPGLNEKSVVDLKNRYGDFFKIFVTRIVPARDTSDAAIAAELNYFRNDADIKTVYSDVKKLYSNTDWLKQELESAFRHYKYYFPAKQVPEVITYVSAFNYKNIRLENTLGISLEFYLGADCIYYPSLNFPAYMTRRFSIDYLVPDCIFSFYQTDYGQSTGQTDMLTQMIYYGKMFYFCQKLVPTMHDSIITGYTKNQLQWVKKHEEVVWTVLLENKVLFSTDFTVYNKFIAEGNTTPGFKGDAPAALGKYIGWQIIKKYMDNHPDVTLEALLANNNAQQIFQQSGYKPGR